MSGLETRRGRQRTGVLRGANPNTYFNPDVKFVPFIPRPHHRVNAEIAVKKAAAKRTTDKVKITLASAWNDKSQEQA